MRRRRSLFAIEPKHKRPTNNRVILLFYHGMDLLFSLLLLLLLLLFLCLLPRISALLTRTRPTTERELESVTPTMRYADAVLAEACRMPRLVMKCCPLVSASHGMNCWPDRRPEPSAPGRIVSKASRRT